MTMRERLAAEFEDELRSPASFERSEDSWLDVAIGAALADAGLSDASIALLMEIAGAEGLSQGAAASEVLVEPPSIPARREALGITIEEAANTLGLGAPGYEAVERWPLRWQNTDVARTATYLAELGVRPAAFVRWLASLLPAGPRFAWGYRPGSVADRPVELTDASADRERLISWGRQLLAIASDVAPSTDRREMYGHRWSVEAVARRAADIARSSRERILASELVFNVDAAAYPGGLVALPTFRGPGYPAFQFDERGVPIPLVLEVNALLGAESDPWGVADWWESVDESLSARPADLLAGTAEDLGRLSRAARALVEGD